MFTRKKKPQILLIGDSIRMNYSPPVKKKLKKIAKIVVIKENCEDSAKILNNLHKWLKKTDYKRLKVIHFNCGLHDIKRPFDSSLNNNTLNEYKDNLRDIINILKEVPNCQLIWATITPVIHLRHHQNKSFDRFEDDVIAYNAVAADLMKNSGIPINDLYSIIATNNPEECIKEDGVHMTENGNRLLADAVVKMLMKYL